MELPGRKQRSAFNPSRSACPAADACNSHARHARRLAGLLFCVAIRVLHDGSEPTAAAVRLGAELPVQLPLLKLLPSEAADRSRCRCL